MRAVPVRLASVVGLLLAALVATLSAHLKVEKTLPEIDATIEVAPSHVRVWFSQSPTVPVSSLTLEGPQGRVELGKVVAGQTDGQADRSLVAPVVGTVAPGTYTVSWKTAGGDGHIQTGTFGFTLKAAGR